MTSSEIELTCRKKLKDDSNCDPRMKDVLRSLKQTISNPISFFGCKFWWKIEHNWLKPRLLKPTAFAIGIQETQIRRLFEPIPVSEPTTVKMMFSELDKHRLIKLETEKIISQFSETTCGLKSEMIALDTAKTVVDFIHSVLGSLEDILGCEADAIIPLKEQIHSLKGNLRFLVTFSWFVYRHGSKNLFSFAKAVAVNTIFLLHFWLVDEKNNEDKTHEVKAGISYLVEKIKPFREDVIDTYTQDLRSSSHNFVIDEYDLAFYDCLVDNLKELLNYQTSSMVAEDKKIEVLLTELTFLRRSILDSSLLESTEELKDLASCAAEMIRLTGYSNFRYVDGKRKPKRSSRWNSKRLQDCIKVIKIKSLQHVIPESWHFDFPRTNEIGFINFLVKDLKERLCYESPAYDALKPQFETIFKELLSLREYINPIAEFRNKNQDLRVLFTHYKDVIYDADYVVDICLCGSNSLWFCKRELCTLTKKIKNVQEEVEAFRLRMNNEAGGHDIVQNLNHVSAHITPPNSDAVVDIEDLQEYKKDEDTNELVGFKDESNKIIGELTRGSNQLKILSLVGMPGLGKTTLANYVYNEPLVTSFFHVRAWCSVSQVYKKETLLSCILQQILGQWIDCQSDPEEKLYKSLKGKRYLVVIDDIWTIEPWNDLKDSFTDDNNVSRIIFTTRQRAVALQANSIPHALRLLSNEQSWKLLQVKVFKEKTCPPELFQVGKRIAENCKGLPLSVILIAGLMKNSQRDEDSWEDIAKRLWSHEIRNPQKQHHSILEASYSHLPDYLKPCFLYFGAFPEDTEIPVQKLVRLWIAEGFVQLIPQTEEYNLENQAENYLNDLIDRSLVTIGKGSSRGGVKTCCVHDLLYDFCLDRSKSETFLLRINRHLGYLHKDENSLKIEHFHVEDGQYRLSIHPSGIPEFSMTKFPSRIRTLLLSNPESPRFSRYLKLTIYSSICQSLFHDLLIKFRLLRVLDLSTIDVTNATEASGLIPLFKLVCLRYLAVFATINEIPREIGNLKNLETFLLSGTVGVVVLPKAIWNMVSMRHLHITHWPGGSFHFPCCNQEFLEEFSQLDKLTSISNPVLHYGKYVEKLMRKLPNLQKLKCVFSASCDDSRKFNLFPALDFLNRLQSLKISFSGMVSFPCKFSFPRNLKKLTLSLFRLPWDEISVIGRLPNLEVLKLLERAFEGERWDMKEGEFQKLKFLKLDSIDVELWNASNEDLPVLEQLVLFRCKRLKEIPYSFAEIPTLRMIEVKWCKPSVRQIQEEVYNMGNEQLNFRISQPHQDFDI